jgi:hypothetical protein
VSFIARADDHRSIGLKGVDDHSPKETADLRTLPVQAKRAAILIARLASKWIEAGLTSCGKVRPEPARPPSSSPYQSPRHESSDARMNALPGVQDRGTINDVANVNENRPGRRCPAPATRSVRPGVVPAHWVGPAWSSVLALTDRRPHIA